MVVRLKLITVGDAGVGKSSLFITHSTGTFPSEFVTRVFDQHSVGGTIDDTDVEMALWDTDGEDVYDGVRYLSYPSTDVFFVCFSVDNRESFDRIESKWVQEVRNHCPDVPLVLVACKIDCRTSSSRGMITYNEGQEVAKRHGMKYCETSSLTHVGLENCFDKAMRSAIAARKTSQER